ncbi:MAG TPA: hypothetical protein VK008_02550 [Sphingobacteriaceae bacterium]|nr:hypothetical protein [Sphingobacteriaceae bacterium]
MTWDLFWLLVRLLLIFVFLGIGFSLALGFWRNGRVPAALCPSCGHITPITRAKRNQHCRGCGTAVVENHAVLPGVSLVKVGTDGRY